MLLFLLTYNHEAIILLSSVCIWRYMGAIYAYSWMLLMFMFGHCLQIKLDDAVLTTDYI